jgi:hypothetical protein
MKLTTVFSRLIAAGFAIMLSASMMTTNSMAEEDGGTPHYPINHPKHAKWSFSGPFGHWDIGQRDPPEVLSITLEQVRAANIVCAGR